MPIKINKELKYLGKLEEDINKLIILHYLTPSPISKKKCCFGRVSNWF